MSPPLTIRDARYRVDLAMSASGPPGAAAATVRVQASATGEIVGQRAFTVASLAAAPPTMTFSSRRVQMVTVSVEDSGQAALSFTGVQGSLAGPAQSRDEPIRRDAWKGLLWLVVLGGGAILLGRRGPTGEEDRPAPRAVTASPRYVVRGARA
jgi:hypothetical protein